MRRKSPIRHKVRKHIRKNKLVREYQRGHGRRQIITKRIYTGRVHSPIFKRKQPLTPKELLKRRKKLSTKERVVLSKFILPSGEISPRMTISPFLLTFVGLKKEEAWDILKELERKGLVVQVSGGDRMITGDERFRINVEVKERKRKTLGIKIPPRQIQKHFGKVEPGEVGKPIGHYKVAMIDHTGELTKIINKAVGVAEVDTAEAEERGEGADWLLIENIYVKPKFRGKKLGSKLLGKMMRRAKKMGYDIYGVPDAWSEEIAGWFTKRGAWELAGGRGGGFFIPLTKNGKEILTGWER